MAPLMTKAACIYLEYDKAGLNMLLRYAINTGSDLLLRLVHASRTDTSRQMQEIQREEGRILWTV